jgi:hypothetical protein
VPKHPLDKAWLEALLASEIEHHDPEAALARLPGDVRHAGASPTDLAPAAKLLVARSLRHRRLEAEPPDATAAFLEDVRLHVALLLDLGVLRGGVFEASRRRHELAAFLAAALGEDELAQAAYIPASPPRVVDRALRASAAALEQELFPPGDPVRGLPLHPGHVAVQRRRLARIAMGHHRHGRLDPAALARHAGYAERELVLLVETLAGLLASVEPAEPADARALAVRRRQLTRLGLGKGALKAARAALSPRPPAEIARGAPEPVRAFLVEQLFLGVLRAKLAGDGPQAFVDSFTAAAGLDTATLAAARVEAAAQHGDHQVWFDVLGGGGAWAAFAEDWDHATDQLVERVSSAVTDNLEAIGTEIRETGELGALLAKAAAGTTLTADEKRKVRAQLVDLAKAVPALAVFAAPGGMLLLPLLAKLLPFNLLPSAWDKPAADAAGRPAKPAKPPKAPAAG